MTTGTRILTSNVFKNILLRLRFQNTVFCGSSDFLSESMFQAFFQ